MLPLVITESALGVMVSSGFPLEILTSDAPIATGYLRTVIGDHGKYVFVSEDASSRALVIRRSFEGLFESVPDDDRRMVFDRCARLALHGFDDGISINKRWSTFHHDNRISIFARGIGHQERIVAETNTLGSGWIYIYEYGTGPRIQHLEDCEPDHAIFKCALDELPKVLSDVDKDLPRVEGQIELDDENLGSRSIARGFSYTEWYTRLSARQRDFVDLKLTGPLRLRGAAGTGKTLAMVMKAVATYYNPPTDKSPPKILYLTHSWPMAEQVDALIADIDHRGQAAIDVFPLLTVSQRRDYAAVGRRPLGLDSHEGKTGALAEVSWVITNFVKSDWMVYRPNCSPDFVAQIEALPGSLQARGFAWDVLIEFGCVIAANGLIGHDGDRHLYLKIKRMRWMMPLERDADKEATFSLWAAFLNRLQEMQAISSDQIIADALNELSTFYWEAARLKEGYDVIFVDEMHLFNAQERLIVHNLLADAGKRPLVVMALDPKQSPREVFTAISEDRENDGKSIYDRARLPDPEKIDFVDVYRYTPEIASLVRSVLSEIPALDLAEEWNVVSAESVGKKGPTPEIMVVPDAQATFKTAMQQAKSLQKDARARKGRVAVLCLDDDRFTAYIRALGQFSEDAILISSRDEVENLRYAKSKIVFSTPEYVAGLQFDSVILVDVNRDLIPESKYNGHQVRRFLSELYLGITRAEHRLLILASRDAGGMTPFLNKAVADGVLKNASQT